MTAEAGPRPGIRGFLPDEVLAHLEEVAATAATPDGVDGGADSWASLPPLPAPVMPDLPRYQLLDVLGQGGMGTVYRALDLALGREVALKMVAPPAAGRSAAAEERLLAEARILARLEHPGLVPVHDLGTLPDGRVFYAMKQVRGRRLDAYAAERRAGGRAELLRVFERICEAVAFAHAHGVIHRDLKPENVMVGSFGEVLVLDWGLAKLLAAPDAAPPPAPSAVAMPPASAAPAPPAPTRVASIPAALAPPAPPAPPATAPGAILGTPGYMAPEQCRGGAADRRSDVFALGAILRFLLAGSPSIPVTPASSATPASPATKATPASPATAAISAAPAVPPALLAICAKATAAEPEQRYAGAAELAADLGRYLAGARVDAFPEGMLRRTVRLARRYATPILLLLAYVLMRLVLLYLARRP